MRCQKSIVPAWRVVAAAALGAVVGCAPRPAVVSPSGAPAMSVPTPSDNLDRLVRLFQQRRAATGDGDYVLGAGDVLAVHAFDFEEMNQRVRVDGDGTVTLPLLGSVPVAGQTVTDVQRELTKRLGGFMFNPNLTVFVEEYRSQQVAVVGAVQKPGLVSQTGRTSTVLDALSAAGGMTADAGSRIYLIPGEDRAHPETQGIALALRNGQLGALDETTLRDAAPIVVDTADVNHEAQRYFFTVPVRGGDVILVPNAGHFVISGWVEKPGTYPLHPNLTLRGAIATAGGLSFPAKTSRIRVYSPGAGGETTHRDVNFDDVTAQRSPDVTLHEGDVVEVESTIVKLVPYETYKVASDLIRVGSLIRVVP